MDKKYSSSIRTRHQKIADMMVERATLNPDRGTVGKDFQPSYTGFTPRRIERLATTKKPTTALDVERRSVLRSSRAESAHLNDPISYRLWLEAGKYPAPFPQRPDPDYNANVWRNFSARYGFSASAEGRGVTELIAGMYPINVPKPSKIGDYTFDRYLHQANLIEDNKRREMAIVRSKTDIKEFKRMRMLSDARNPPLGERGDILPPRDFQHYPHHRPVGPSEDVIVELVELPPDIRPDIFGRFRKVKDERPHRWKLEYKLNHPKPDKVHDELRKKAQNKESFRVPISTERVPLWKR